MAAKTTTTSGFSILTRILDPFLLFAVTGILHTAVKRVYMNPLLAEMSRHLSEMEAHTADHSSAEYARLVQETQQDATSLVVISIAVALVTLMLAFAKQIVACCFGGTRAASSSNSGGSLAELLGEVSKWRNLRIPVIATAAILAIFQLLSVALLGASFPTAMHDLGLLSVQESLFLVAFVALFYLCMLAMTIVGSRRKEFSVLVLATLLLPTLLIPVCGFGLLHLIYS